MISATDPAPVERPDPGPAESARDRLSTLEHGPRALGELADLAAWAASVQGVAPAPGFVRARCLLLAADHGVAHGPSLPRVEALLEGTGPQALLARTAGVEVRIVDVGLDSEPVAGVDNRRIRRGSGRIDQDDALTADEVLDAVALGRQLVDEEVDGGTDLLIPAAVGMDAALPATALIATLSRTEPIWALGFGAIRDDAEWARWCRVIRDCRRRADGGPDEPFRLLALIGGADVAVLAGVLVQAAVRRTPVLLDGTVGAAAGLLARELAAESPSWWRAPQRNGSASERTALDMLQLESSVPLGLHLGEGCGALATVPLLRTAVAVMAELTTEPPPKPVPPKIPGLFDDVEDDEPARDDTEPITYDGTPATGDQTPATEPEPAGDAPASDNQAPADEPEPADNEPASASGPGPIDEPTGNRPTPADTPVPSDEPTGDEPAPAGESASDDAGAGAAAWPAVGEPASADGAGRSGESADGEPSSGGESTLEESADGEAGASTSGAERDRRTGPGVPEAGA